MVEFFILLVFMHFLVVVVVVAVIAFAVVDVFVDVAGQ